MIRFVKSNFAGAPPFQPRLNANRSSPATRCRAENLGDRVLPMLRDPSDWLLFPGRVAIGALLSTDQNISRLPEDLEKATSLLSDPRPLEEKQAEILRDVEDRVAAFLEKSLGVENEVILRIDDALPQDAKEALPETVKRFLTVREISSERSVEYTTASVGDSKPLATWTITSMDEDDNFVMPAGSSSMAVGRTTVLPLEEEQDAEPPASAATVAESQAAAEMVEIQAAVMAVREQLTALQNNTEPSKVPMIKLNLKEAAQSLERRLEQRSGVLVGNGDGNAAMAVAEAEELLEEVRHLE